MPRKRRRRGLALCLIATTLLTSASAQVASNGKPEPLVIRGQGSVAAGGKVITNTGTFNPKQPAPDGQTLHGDHAYVFYQIPVSRRKLPLVFLHGAGQFSKTWETTPEGRACPHAGSRRTMARRRAETFRRGSARKTGMTGH